MSHFDWILSTGMGFLLSVKPHLMFPSAWMTLGVTRCFFPAMLTTNFMPGALLRISSRIAWRNFLRASFRSLASFVALGTPSLSSKWKSAVRSKLPQTSRIFLKSCSPVVYQHHPSCQNVHRCWCHFCPLHVSDEFCQTILPFNVRLQIKDLC